MPVSMLFSETFRSDLQSRIRNPEASFALSQWLISKGSNVLPEEDNCRLLAYDWLKQDLMILRLNEQGELYYDWYGPRIAAHANFDMSGKKVSDFKGELGTFFLSTYAAVFSEPQAVATVHRLGAFKERPMWERIILPVAEKGQISALYVVNRILDLHHDFNLTAARTKNSGIIALQFERDASAKIVSGIIIGANKTARNLCNRRYDELVGFPMQSCFPGIVEKGLWDKYLAVHASQVPCNFIIEYDTDGISGLFDVTLSPFRDGILIDFILSTPSQSKGA